MRLSCLPRVQCRLAAFDRFRPLSTAFDHFRPLSTAFDGRAARGICGRPGMLAQRQHLLASVLDLALSYFAVIFVILLAYPLLNKWLLEA
jgi:hypothetical protein